MTVSITDEPIFENEEWLVDEQGLEHKLTGYFIDRDALPSRRPDGLWSWPMHMAEKTWCTMPAFMEAFSCAVAVYGIPSDLDLAHSFRVARCEIADWPRSMQPKQALGLHSGSPARRRDDERGAQPSASSADVPRPRPMALGSSALALGRPRSVFGAARARSLPWRARRSFRRAGTNIARIIQAVWNIK